MWLQTIHCEIKCSTAHLNSKLVGFTNATASRISFSYSKRLGARFTFHCHTTALQHCELNVSLGVCRMRQHAHTTSKTNAAKCMWQVSGNELSKLDAMSHVSLGTSSSTDNVTATHLHSLFDLSKKHWGSMCRRRRRGARGGYGLGRGLCCFINCHICLRGLLRSFRHSAVQLYQEHELDMENVASSTPVQPPETLFHPTFTTLLSPVHSENDSRAVLFDHAYN